MSRRVLLCLPHSAFQSTDWTNNYRAAFQYMQMWLSNMGYDVDARPIQDTSTFASTLTASSYEFIVLPHVRGAGWTTWTSGSAQPIGQMVKGNVPITVFVLGVDQDNNAIMLANVGAGPKAIASGNARCRWRGCDWHMPQTAYSLTQQAHMGQLETLQTHNEVNASVAWRYRGANGWVYVQSGQQYNGYGHSLHLLMVEAIEAGHIQPPPRKHKIVIDLDDMPEGSTGTITLADCERVYAAQQRMNMPSAWGMRPEDWVGGRVPAEVTAFIAARTADKGGLLYPVVHRGNWYWKDGTKAEKEALFLADIATMAAAGIRVGRKNSMVDQWGYYYANNNAWDAGAFELGSPENAIWCDPLDTTAKEGYGWKVCRLDSFNLVNNEGYGVPKNSSIGQRTEVRGIRLIGAWTSMASTDLAIDFDGDAASRIIAVNAWASMFTFLGARQGAKYVHGSNMYDGHDGGNAPGTRWLESLADLYQAGMNRVVEYVHGSQLVNSSY